MTNNWRGKGGCDATLPPIFMTITVAHQCRKVDESEAGNFQQHSSIVVQREGGGGGVEGEKPLSKPSICQMWFLGRHNK